MSALKEAAKEYKLNHEKLSVKNISAEDFTNILVNKVIFDGFKVVNLPRLSLYECQVLCLNTPNTIILSTRKATNGYSFTSLSMSYRIESGKVVHKRIAQATLADIKQIYDKIAELGTDVIKK